MNLKALQAISYGLYVIGSRQGDRLNAQIANAVLQVTAEPPTIAVSINKQNLTHQFIEESRVFTVSVLCQDTPLSFIAQFGFKSGRDSDKLAGANYKLGETGAPVVIDNAVACLEVAVTQEVDVGSHTIFIGELVAAELISDKACLTYEHYYQVKRGATPRTAPLPIEEKKMPAKYECTICGYVYDEELGDPENGIAPGTPFAALPDDWVCPVCGAPKSDFEKMA